MFQILRMSIAITAVTFLLTGCMGAKPNASTHIKDNIQHKVMVEKSRDMIKKDFTSFNYSNIPTEFAKNSKVFMINVFSDEKSKYEDMFNVAISKLQKNGICSLNKKTKEKECIKPTVQLTKDGYKAKLLFDEHLGSWSKMRVKNSLENFDRMYFPGFKIFNNSLVLFSVNSLEIKNNLMKDVYNKTQLTGVVEELFKDRDIKMVSSPDEADYVVVYQNTAFNLDYKGRMANTLPLILNLNENKDKNIHTDIIHTSTTMGFFETINYAKIFSQATGANYTPTLGLGFLFNNVKEYTVGAAYEFIVLDKTKKTINHYVEENYIHDRYLRIERAVKHLAYSFVNEKRIKVDEKYKTIAKNLTYSKIDKRFFIINNNPKYNNVAKVRFDYIWAMKCDVNIQNTSFFMREKGRLNKLFQLSKLLKKDPKEYENEIFNLRKKNCSSPL